MKHTHTHTHTHTHHDSLTLFTVMNGATPVSRYYADGAATIDRAYERTTSYLFGSSMLVAPIVTPIAAGSTSVSQTTWLPPGQWVAFSGATSHLSPPATGLDVTASYALDSLPIFIRAGAVVAMRTLASISQAVAFSDPLIWCVWPGSGAVMEDSGNATVVEDDGATLRFETDNAIATTTMHWVATTGSYTLTVDPTVGSFDVNGNCGDIDVGVEYGGAGANLQVLQGTFDTHADCCHACSTFSNCAFWTWTNDTHRCMLKVSRQGRKANASTVSGVAPRRMPTERGHGFQLRKPTSAAATTSVTVNGHTLPKITPGDDGKTGWFVESVDATQGLARAPPGTLVILTDKIALTQQVVVRMVFSALA